MLRLSGHLIALVVLACPLALADKISTLDYIESIAPPQMMTGVGNSHLQITTDVPEAQAFFDQGVSLLRDFWWFESYRSFLQASTVDPNSPMPQWGLYMAGSEMANLSREQRGELLDNAITKMAALRDNSSPREHYYLDSVARLHADEDGEGDSAYKASLVALLNEYPDEIEARLLLWRMLDTGYDAAGKPKSEQLYGQLLLEREFEKHGKHQGLLHYWIHSQEPGAHPESALDAAKRLARLAPKSGHIVHMPGHIHYLTGNYGKAHEQFVRAEQADDNYMKANDIDAIFVWNYLHNFSFMMSNLAEAGRFLDGEQYAGILGNLTEQPAYRHIAHFEMLLGRAIMEQAYMAIRLENFALAAELIRDKRWDGWEKSAGLKALMAAYEAYSSGMAAALAGDRSVAESHSRTMDSILWRAQRDKAPLRYRSTPLKIAALELQGLVAAISGDDEEAIELLTRAVEKEREIEYGEPRSNIHPAAETLGNVQTRLGNYEAARESFRSVLKQRPNAGLPLFGIAYSYEQSGDLQQARKAYKTFLKAWVDADDLLPQKKHSREWLANN
jgi:tetratricopeptide (TPR) repeat protein